MIQDNGSFDLTSNWGDSTPGWLADYIEGFNFDPEMLEPSVSINGVAYMGYFEQNNSSEQLIVPVFVNPLADVYAPVTGNFWRAGGFITGLTYDDAGGLRYLYSTNNVNYETLLPDVQGIGTEAVVNGAWRPGVNKLTFVPQPVGASPGTFLPLTNQFTDTYITNGQAIRQPLQRVTLRPDFLFSAGNDPARSGTTNWINHAALNNKIGGAGPGIIQPPINITFQKMGSYFYNTNMAGGEDTVEDWTTYMGSFDGTTNKPVVYPAASTGDKTMTVRLWLQLTPVFQKTIEWQAVSPAGTVFAVQTSTNLQTWNTLFTVTNNGSLCIYQNDYPTGPARFYRLVPQ